MLTPSSATNQPIAEAQRPHQYINTLTDKQVIYSTYALIEATAGTAANGTPFGKFRVEDRTGEITIMRFDVPPETVADVAKEKFLTVRIGKASLNKYGMQIKAEALAIAAEEDIDFSIYEKVSPFSANELEDRLQSYYDSIANPTLAAIVNEILIDPISPAYQPYRIWPAAKEMHHAFGRGLIHHTLEVVDFAVADAAYQAEYGRRPLFRDLLVAGALLHDVGKIQEFEKRGTTWDYSRLGNLHGHLNIGSQMIYRAADAIKARGNVVDFDDSVVDLLVHMVQSHHMKREWDASAQPAFIEAWVLAAADGKSAQLAYLLDAERDAIARGDSESFIRQNRNNDVPRLYPGVAAYVS